MCKLLILFHLDRFSFLITCHVSTFLSTPGSQTLNVLVKNGLEVQQCPVKVLDIDTITQVPVCLYVPNTCLSASYLFVCSLCAGKRQNPRPCLQRNPVLSEAISKQLGPRYMRLSHLMRVSHTALAHSLPFVYRMAVGPGRSPDSFR